MQTSAATLHLCCIIHLFDAAHPNVTHTVDQVLEVTDLPICDAAAPEFCRKACPFLLTENNHDNSADNQSHGQILVISLRSVQFISVQDSL